MSQKQHLLRAVQILRNAFQQEINDNYEWSYNLKHWTIQFYVSDDDMESVCAYKVHDKVTDWSDWIVLELRNRKLEEVGKHNMSMTQMIELLVANDERRFENDPDDCLHNWIYMREFGWDGYTSWRYYDLFEELHKRGLLKRKENV
jgi:hypothetical protein